MTDNLTKDQQDKNKKTMDNINKHATYRLYGYGFIIAIFILVFLVFSIYDIIFVKRIKKN